MRPRAIVRCGIWISTRRAAIVTATTAATTPTMMMTSTSSENAPIAPVLTNLNVEKMPGQMRSTIEKKIIKLAPLPMPRSVICSPSHMTKIAPVVRKNVIGTRNAKPGFATAPGSDFGEDREAPRLHGGEHHRRVARPLVDLFPALFVLRHLVDLRHHGLRDLLEDARRDVRHDAEREHRRARRAGRR